MRAPRTRRGPLRSALVLAGALLVIVGCSGGAELPRVSEARIAIAEDAVWAWRVDAPAEGWEQSDDTAGWSLGPAPLGFEADGLRSEIGDPAATTPPGLTAYFRHAFEVADPSVVRGGTLRFRRDDGVALFLNGSEIVRSNLPGGALADDTRAKRSASGDEESAWIARRLDPRLLVAGTNHLAARVHQQSKDSSDLAFGLRLEFDREGDEPTILRGPYLQQAGPKGVLLRWETSSPTVGKVLYGLSPRLELEAREPRATVEHRLPLAPLPAGATIHYAIVKAGDGIWDRHHTVIPPKAGATTPVRFWITGDPGTGSETARAVHDGFVRRSNDLVPTAWLTLGDNAYPSGTAADLQFGFFTPLSTALARFPLWPSLGNHDVVGVRGTERTPSYFEVFDLPTRGQNGGEPSGSEAYYAFDHGNVHVVVLDSTTGLGSGAGPQLDWLERDLAATTQDWIIATFHHPPISRGTHDGDEERSSQRVREQLVPLLDAAGADLVVAGHSHNYERSELVDGPLPSAADWASARVRAAGPDGFEKAGGRAPGTIYLVAGNAGQSGPGPLDHPAMVVSAARQGSVVVDVEGCTLRATAWGDDGEAFDAFTIRKGAPCGGAD